MHSIRNLLVVSAVILLPASVIPSAGFATDLVNANASGGVGSGSLFEIGTGSIGAGVYSDNDAAVVSSVEFSGGSVHLVIGDASFFSGFFFGGQGLGTDNEVAFYQLRLEGSVSGGLQAWKVVPLTLAAEDLSYIKTPDGSRSTALLGTTVYLPVHLSKENQVLFVALAAGARFNSELDGNAFAIQPKVRFISDRVTAELRYLMSLGSVDDERKLSVSASLRDLLRQGDEVGISFSQTWTSTLTQASQRGGAIIVHYGLSY